MVETLFLSEKGVEKTSTNNITILLKDKDKKDKKIKLKQLFNYYKLIGFHQVNEKYEKYNRQNRLALGLIDEKDYISTDKELKDIDEYCEEDKPILYFYNIIPSLYRILVNDLKRRYVEYYPKAIDIDTINSVIENKKQDIINLLVNEAKKKFDSETLNNLKNKNVEVGSEEYNQELEQREEIFKNLSNIDRYYKTDFKTELEKFAASISEKSDKEHNFENIEKNLIEQQIKYNEHYCEIDIINDNYKPKVWESSNTFYLRSNSNQDASDYTMIGTFEYEDIVSIISKYGHLLNSKQIETIEKWNPIFLSENLKTYRDKWLTKENSYKHEDNVNNYNILKNHFNTYSYYSKISENIDNNKLIQITKIYMLIPRKLGKLTAIYNKQTKEIYKPAEPITDLFEITVEPEYISDEKTAENLIYGEHIDWYYQNEVYKGIEISPVYFATNFNTEEIKDYKPIFAKLEKLEYQFRKLEDIYVSKIPVHGTKYPDLSIVESLEPYQIPFNYLYNKILELIAYELMPYHTIDERILNNNTVEGSFEHRGLQNSLELTQITGLLGINPSQENTGVAPNQIYPYPTTVNLSRRDAILTRLEIAQKLKQDAWEAIGLNNYFLGQMTQKETATSITQGIKSATNQIQHIYDRHYELVRKIKETIVDAAQYVYYTYPNNNFQYIDSDAQRVIFNLNKKSDISLTKQVGIFFSISAKETELLLELKQMAKADNTIDFYERALTINEKSPAKILSILKQNRDLRNQQQQQQLEQQQIIQKNEIESQKEYLYLKNEFEAQQNQLDREYKLIGDQLKAYGYSNNNDSNDNKIFDVLELTKLNQENNLKYDSINEKNKLEHFKIIEKLKNDKQNAQLQYQKLNNDYNSKLKELENKKYLKEIDYKIAKENK